MATKTTALHPPNMNRESIDNKRNNNYESPPPPPLPARKSNRIYFVFYFFLWMFIGSLWILPPLLFYHISQECNLSLFNVSILFFIYYIFNGISSFLSTFIINSHSRYLIKTHLLTSILIIICIISLQFMLITINYYNQILIWFIISIVDGFINNAAPVYLYRIYHIEASVMLTLCTIIANFIMIIISMSTINTISYKTTINFISFFGIISCFGLITLQTPTQKELIKTIKAARNEIIQKKLEKINDEFDRNNIDESSTMTQELKYDNQHNKNQYTVSVAFNEKWHSMKNNVLFNNRLNDRSSVTATLSTYIHQYAPEISFNPSVINTINTANRDSHIQYPINASLVSSKMNNNIIKKQITGSPIISSQQQQSINTTPNTFASSNVRKIIAYSTNPPILAHSANESTNHTLELLWKEIENKSLSQRTTLTQKNSNSTFIQTPLPGMTPLDDDNNNNDNNDNDDNDEDKEDIDEDDEILEQILEENNRDHDDDEDDIVILDETVDNKIDPQLRIHAHGSHKKTQEIIEKERDLIMNKMIKKQISTHLSTTRTTDNTTTTKTAGGITISDYASNITDYVSSATNTPNGITPIGSNNKYNMINMDTATPKSKTSQTITGYTSNRSNNNNLLLNKKSTRRVLFAENIRKENIEKEKEKEKEKENEEKYCNKSPSNHPSMKSMRSSTDIYWFDIEKRFESFSLNMSKRQDTALASYIYNNQENGELNPSEIVKGGGSGYNSPQRMSETFSNDRSYDITLYRQSTVKTHTFIMKPIEEKKEDFDDYQQDDDDDDDDYKEEQRQQIQRQKQEEEQKQKQQEQQKQDLLIQENEVEITKQKVIENYLKKSKQTLFICILLITMIYSAQKICFLSFITIYILQFVGGKEFIGTWLITIYLFGHFISRILIIFILKKYSPKNILLICQLLMLINCIILLMVDWLHFGKPMDNKQSRKFTKIMLYLILFIGGLISSPIYVICYSFLNKIQKVTQFVSTMINIGTCISNAISIILMSLIINKFGIETFPYYITLILFLGLIIVIILIIKYMLFTQQLRKIY